MSVTTPQAVDEMRAIFFDWWRNHAHEAWDGGVPEVVWQGVQTDGNVARSTLPWARHAVMHRDGAQRTFGETSRFEREGFVFVQVFAPKDFARGFETAEALAVVARNAYEGKQTPSGVWFRSATHREVGSAEPWWQFNVDIEFTYEERK